MYAFHSIQEWDGYVIEIQDDHFFARLTDLTAGHSYESEEANIPLAAISECDASCIKVGGVFRWVIGYEISLGGERRAVSQIVFRQFPRITEDDIRRGWEWAKETLTAFGL